jgi:hypothetical protein
MHYFNCSSGDGKLWATTELCHNWVTHDGMLCPKVD